MEENITETVEAKTDKQTDMVLKCTVKHKRPPGDSSLPLDRWIMMLLGAKYQQRVNTQHFAAFLITFGGDT